MSQSSLIRAAEWLDGLVTSGLAPVESVDRLVLNKLSAEHLRALGESELGHWPAEIEDASGTPVTYAELDDALEPFRASLQKPLVQPGCVQLVTIAGLIEWLSRPEVTGVVEAARAQVVLDTFAFRLQPWGGPSASAPMDRELKSPWELVRETREPRQAPQAIGHWLSADLTQEQAADVAVRAWMDRASPAIMRALASEISPDGALVFRGPLRLRLDPPLVEKAEAGQLNSLLAAARWVFENIRETENRHTLLAAEISRNASGIGSPTTVLGITIGLAFDGARIAYQLGLDDQIGDALKALADLRKSLTDETNKLAETTRQLAGSVAAAISVGVGLLAAKLTTATPKLVIAALTVIVVGYIGAVVYAGVRQTQLQRDIRWEWKRRLYRFLPDPDYQAMVTRPTKRAEQILYTTCWIGGVATAILAGLIGLSFL